MDEKDGTQITFAIKSASVEEKKTIFTLLQAYLDELSHLPDEKIECKDENGIYHYPYLDSYWRESERYPYLLMSDRKLAGFAFVRQEGDHWEMAEFYVLPEFRRRGLASACVRDILRKHPGEWRIDFNKYNQAGRTLWEKLAYRSSNGDILSGELNTSHNYIRFSY
jgi:predicted acetyltransferase